MENNIYWVALLDDDEDDFVFWQHGFSLWANHLDLKWFSSVNSFLEFIKIAATRPTILILDGVAIRGEESSILNKLVNYPGLENVAIIVLSGQFHQEEHQTYLNLGAVDHLIKPNNDNELKGAVLKVSSYTPNNNIML